MESPLKVSVLATARSVRPSLVKSPVTSERIEGNPVHRAAIGGAT